VDTHKENIVFLLNETQQWKVKLFSRYN